MKFVIAPDSFKESVRAGDVASLVEAGFREVFPDADYILVPMADGGEGTVDAVTTVLGGRIKTVSVTDPLGRQIWASYGFVEDRQLAVIEMAAASGLELVAAAERDVARASSFGTGELVRHALDLGASHIILGVGGSATNDAGAGALQALGIRFLDSLGQDLPPGGGSLSILEHIDIRYMDPRLKNCKIELATDVTAPLLGPQGSSSVFGPQKGASAEIVETLERSLQRFAVIANGDLGQDVSAILGGGAGGGLAAGFIAALNAYVRPGWKVVADAVNLASKIRGADLVITGEGRTDGQSVMGKTPVGVSSIALEMGVPVVILSGSLGAGADQVLTSGVAGTFASVTRPCLLSEALAEAPWNIRSAARNIAAVLKLGASLA
ncbi:glycerate kinase [Rhizobium mesosinicum]|uniref:Glycerate kinase n=1 Tax=Rhizobium mesosinicum TaxID=335017 RepID=A0ABS7GP64_9HYPH|nr:glycerate kinase [Rhizobium mesosinicum]MBW9051024.1 glycerate kinase [Rhizobium mesosinicum]